MIDGPRVLYILLNLKTRTDFNSVLFSLFNGFNTLASSSLDFLTFFAPFFFPPDLQAKQIPINNKTASIQVDLLLSNLDCVNLKSNEIFPSILRFSTFLFHRHLLRSHKLLSSIESLSKTSKSQKVHYYVS